MMDLPKFDDNKKMNCPGNQVDIGKVINFAHQKLNFEKYIVTGNTKGE